MLLCALVYGLMYFTLFWPMKRYAALINNWKWGTRWVRWQNEAIASHTLCITYGTLVVCSTSNDVREYSVSLVICCGPIPVALRGDTARMPGKKIHTNAIKGQQGINLIEAVVYDMGFVWYPTGQVEAGIDGYIEIRDPVTGVVTNSIIQVQSKATDRPFVAESGTSFEYLCDAEDLRYWIAGNAPVILIVSRPSTREAYWITIKEYFSDPVRLKSRKVVFDKTRTRFDVSCRQALINLAVPRDVGLYLAPQPKRERLYSNLLTVTYYPERLFVAETPYREAKDLWAVVRARDLDIGGEWILHDRRIYSFYDLRESPWDTLCDRGTVEDFSTEEWASASDASKRRQFVNLLNRCLIELGRSLDIAFDAKLKHYYFRATANLSARKFPYQSLMNMTSKIVFQAYLSKTQKDRTAYYRHSAFEGQFRFYDGTWFLEITPTYHFTRDGHHPDPFYEERLKGIKRLERNSAVLGQLVMWAAYLGQPTSLFSARPPMVHFGSLQTIDLNAGIHDEAWRSHEEGDEAQTLANPENEGLWGEA